MLLDLLRETGIETERISTSRGGIWASPCPQCKEGRDRFVVWEDTDRYWCRRCGINGDAIQFCRDFLGMNYHEARERVGCVYSGSFSYSVKQDRGYQPHATISPDSIWDARAQCLVASATKHLLDTPEGLIMVLARGITMASISRFQLGWNERDIFEPFQAWGLLPAFKENGSEKKVWVPRGIVIPFLWKESVKLIKVRRADWSSTDRYPKYVHVSGGSNRFSVYGGTGESVVVLLEAELDAILVVQEAGDLCCCLALGGLKKPDEQTHRWLLCKRLILFALDFDEAGKAWYPFWKKTYPQLCPWPAPVGKSPEVSFKEGKSLRVWVESGIRHNLTENVF